MDDLMSKLRSVLEDEESMKQVKELADMLSGGEGAQPEAAKQEAPPAIDPAMLIKIQSVLSQASKPDKNIDFLMALRPLLRDENKQKIDRVIKLLRLMSLYPAIKESGILGGDLLGIL